MSNASATRDASLETANILGPILFGVAVLYVCSTVVCKGKSSIADDAKGDKPIQKACADDLQSLS